MTTPGDLGQRISATTTAAGHFGWLLSHFTRSAADVTNVVAVSSDGRLLAAASALTRADAQRLATVAVSMNNLASGAGHACDGGAAGNVVVHLERGYLLVSPINSDCLVGIVVGADADLAALTNDLASLVNRVAPAVTPELIDELATALASERTG